ncbi:MAG: ribose-phosphate pyrophosphokinase [Acidobacteriota bacterium]
MDNFILLAGRAHPDLVKAIADELGLKPGACAIERFPDGEVSIKLLETVRHKEVFIVQPTSPPVNENLVELLVLVDACRRASAKHITAVVPYFGYARMDKRHGREPIAARMVADLMQNVGVDHAITIDLHAAQIEGFFHIPVDNLTAVPVLCNALRDRLPKDFVVVSPDAGAMKMATEYAHRLGASVILIHKRRESGSKTHVTHLVGDVSGRGCLIVDDMISTGGTIAESIEVLLVAGARPEIIVAVTHGLFLTGTREKLDHESVSTIFTTDTMPMREQNWPKLQVVSVAPVIASAIKRLITDGSLSDLF